MFSVREFREKQNRLSDLLPWGFLVAPGVILNKDGSFQSTLGFRGPDLDSSTEEELTAVSARVNNVFKRLGEGFALYIEADRKRLDTYPVSTFPCAVSRLIDAERRESFEADNHYESSYYLTLCYIPPEERLSKIENLFFEGKSKVGVNYEEVLSTYIEEVTRAIKLLKSILPEVYVLSDEELLTYLHAIVSENEHRVRVPGEGRYLDSILSDTNFIGGITPKLGHKFLACVAVKSYPSWTEPGILDALNRLNIEYRWVTRFISLSKPAAEKELNKYKKRWFSKRKGISTLLKETFTGEASVMEDSDAVRKAHDADEALGELLADEVSFGYFTSTIVLSCEDEGRLVKRVREVEKIINSLGFTSKREDLNAVDSWLGSIPGNARNNVRRPLLNTMNLAHLMPLSAVWAGAKKNEHLNGPPLFVARTNGSTQFRFTNHIGDVGHTLVIGPTGSGKSVLLNFIEAQFLRYENAQVYIFDKGGSARALTHGLGGEHFSLGEDSSLNFQPLSNIDHHGERRFSHEWILDILAAENLEITPKVKEEVWVALTSLSTAPKRERTIFGLTVLIQDAAIRQALSQYTVKGAHGGLLDNEVDTFSVNRFQCFEMETLMETPKIVYPVLSYLFHRLEKRFTGAPTLLVLDEAWLFLDNPQFEAKIREWLKVLRKANVSVIFATQSLADVDESKISSTVKEACFTRVFLPNLSAMNEDISKVYKRFGLNKTQIRLLSEAIPKRQYYYTSPLGNRLFELSLGEFSLNYLGATSKEAQALVKECYKNSANHFEFNAKYLYRKGGEELLSKYLLESNGAEALQGEPTHVRADLSEGRRNLSSRATELTSMVSE